MIQQLSFTVASVRFWMCLVAIIASSSIANARGGGAGGGHGGHGGHAHTGGTHSGPVYVSGYFRSNGTFVQGYWRSAANGTSIDNWQASTDATNQLRLLYLRQAASYEAAAKTQMTPLPMQQYYMQQAHMLRWQAAQMASTPSDSNRAQPDANAQEQEDRNPSATGRSKNTPNATQNAENQALLVRTEKQAAESKALRERLETLEKEKHAAENRILREKIEIMEKKEQERQSAEIRTLRDKVERLQESHEQNRERPVQKDVSEPENADISEKTMTKYERLAKPALALVAIIVGAPIISGLLVFVCCRFEQLARILGAPPRHL